MSFVDNGCYKQIKGAVLAGLLLVAMHGSVYAHSYFVSPSGNDSDDGLSPASAWRSLDRGNQLSILVAGDVVNVLPGTYTYTRSMALTTDGSIGSPIVYRRFGTDEAVVDASNRDVEVVSVSGDHVVIDGLTLTNGQRDGILVSGDFCTILNCNIYHVGRDGIRLEGVGCSIRGNTISNTSNHGVQFRATALSGLVYNNTIYGCSENGVEIQSASASARIFNNIIVGNKFGINGDAGNTCGFNDVWDNHDGNYDGHAADSAGGLAVDPRFVASTSKDFRLQLGSPVIDAALDLGFPYNGAAPDMGAHEFDSTSVEGMVIWRTGSALLPKYRLWYGGTYGTSGTADSVGVIRTMQGAMSSTRNEAIMLGLDQDRHISGQMWQGNAWTAFPSNDLATVTESNWWSFDVAYEQLSGDAMVVWNNGTTGLNGLTYRQWDGSSWSTLTLASSPVAGEPKQMHLAASPISNEMVLVVSNASSQDFAAVWNGSAWGNAQVTSMTGAGDNLTDVAVAYEQQSGHAIAVNGDNSGYVFFRQWNGTAWSAEDSIAPPAGATGTVRWTTLASDPSSDRIVLGVQTTTASVWLSVWDGSGWQAAVATALSASGTSYPGVAVAFEGLSGNALACYSATAAVRYLTWTSGGGWASHADVFDLSAMPTTITLSPQPASDRIMLTCLDNAHDLNSRLWDGSAWGSGVELETTVGEGENQPFVFLWSDFGNHPPVLAMIGPRSTTESVNLSIGVSATDLESVPVLTTSALPLGASFVDNGDGTGGFGWTPTTSQTGDYSVTFYATDDAAAVDSEVVAIAVYESVNQPPSMSPIPVRMVSEGSAMNQTVTATDLESVPALTSSALPSGASFTDHGDGTGLFDWTPTYTQSGSYEIMFYATDDSAAVDSSLFSLSVDEAGNQLPVLAAIGIQSVTEGAELTLSVAASDAESVPGLTCSALPSGASYVDSGDGTGSFEWTPTFLQSGVYSVTFYATDDSLAVDSEVVAITVTEAGNRPPVLVGIIDTSTVENVQLTFTVLAGDVESTPVLTAGSLPSGASFSDSGDGTGLFDWTPSGLQAGDYEVTFYATDDSAAVDSQVVSITVTEAALESIAIVPDSLTVSSDSTVQYTVVGYDAEGYETDPGVLTWSLTAALGTIDSTGLFDATTVGTGRVAVQSALGPVDTSAFLEVVAGQLALLRVIPDSVVVGLGDSVQFSVEAYDADNNTTDYGTVSWRALGRIGHADSLGLFIADRPGSGSVAATSSVGAVTDTSAALDVEELYLSTAAIGTGAVNPGDSAALALVLRIDNYFAEDKTITGLTIRNASRGAGSLAQILSNVDSASVYVDKDDDSLLSPGDSLIARGQFSASTAMTFAPLTILADDGLTFLVTADVSLFARDGDSLDMFLRPAVDVVTGDGTIVAGPDSAGSLGYCVVDGMVATQLSLAAVGGASIQTGDSLYHLLTADLPRNGYAVDTLRAFSIANFGTATAEDFDSLVFFRDLADRVWNGPGEETRLGRMVFTGDKWSLSGLSVVLVDTLTRFYVAGSPSAYPTDGRTVAFGIPVQGVEEASQNDGPLDEDVPPVDTFEIQTNEQLLFSATAIPAGTLAPGEMSTPVLAVSIINSYGAAVSVDSLRCTLTLTDPDGATQQQLLSQIDSVLLYADRDGDIRSVSIPDTLLTVGYAVAGKVVFETSGLQIDGSGGVLDLVVVPAMDADNAKDGNTVNLSLAQQSDVFVDPVSTIVGGFPMQSNAGFTVTSFPAALVTRYATGVTVLYGGQTKRPVLDFRLPGDGYAADWLRSIRVEAGGSLGDNATLLTIKLWRNDDGHGADQQANLLGQFAHDGAEWVLDGLSAPVPSGGARFLVTVDVADRQFDGGAVQFSIPIAGVKYESGVDGPDDFAVISEESPLVFASDRITAISVPAGSVVVSPGTTDQNLLTFALYNGYVGETQSLQSVTLTNISRTQSDQAYVDGELGQVSLAFDQNNDRLLNGDPFVATGRFSGGKLRLSGLNVALPAESLSYFFVLGNVAQQSIDSDSLAIAISGMSDLVFGDAVNLNGDLPLVSGGYVVVDGSVTGQYSTPSLQSRTLTPGDTSVPLFAFKPAANGDQSDVLESVRIINLGDATSADISPLRLWLDADGTDQWQASDSLLGTFTYSGGGWSISSLGLAVASPNATLFAVGDIDSNATSGAVFMARIPANGCLYSSDNDGPRDGPVTSTSEFTVSTSPLRVAQSIAGETYSVGQTIVVRLTTTNLSASSLASVYGEIVSIDNPSTVNLDSAEAGPASLGTGESTDFVFYYTAQEAGQVVWQLRAVAPAEPDSSVTVRTRPIRIQTVPENVTVQLVSSIPTAVTRGLANVFPLSLNVIHPDTSQTAAALRLDSLRLDVIDASGTPISAATAFSRLALSTGYTTLVVLDAVPDQSYVTLRFDEPVVIEPGRQQNIALLVDISPDASATSFALGVSDNSAIVLADANTGAPVAINASVAFPLQTESCRIDDPSNLLAVSAVSLLGPVVNLGQHGVNVVQLNLRHPGQQGSSQIQVSAVRFRFVDGALNPVTIASLFEGLTLMRQQVVVGEVAGLSIESDEVNLALSSPLTLNPGDQDSLRITVSLLPISMYASFGLMVDDSTCLTIRDISSGSLVLATTDTLMLATGSVFPIVTSYATLKQSAVGPGLCFADLASSSIVGGVDSLPLTDMRFAYQTDSTYSAVRLNGVQVAVFDEQGSPLNADLLFDKIGVAVADGPVSYQSSIEMVNGLVSVEFGPDGVVLDPGDTVTVRLIGNIEGDVPYENFRLGVQSPASILVHDATDSLRSLSVEPMEGCEYGLPFTTGLTQIFLPAGRPALSVESLPAQIVFAGQTNVSAMRCELTYSGLVASGDITIDGLTGQVFRQTTSGAVIVTGADAFDSIRFALDDSIIAVTTDLSQQTFELTPAIAPVLAMGETGTFGIRCDIKADAVRGNYFIRLVDSTCLRLSDANLATSVYPVVQGVSYPLASADISVVDAGLEQSFTSYPNPFNPSNGEQATIAFVLSEAAHVDIEMFSITGEAVKIIADNSYRDAGPHQSDAWSGVNEIGIDVVPGTYLCRITARYESGATETFRRKVTVIR